MKDLLIAIEINIEAGTEILLEERNESLEIIGERNIVVNDGKNNQNEMILVQKI